VTTIPLMRGSVARMIIATEKAAGAPRGTRHVTLVATFCPVCGEKYPLAKDKPSGKKSKAA
jgi:hypothetical protein